MIDLGLMLAWFFFQWALESAILTLSKGMLYIMEMIIEIPDKDLIEFGRESACREMENTLKWMKIKNSFRKISKALKTMDEKDYFDQLEAIRESACDEYKQEATFKITLL